MKLYIYDHCPYCVKARMIFGIKNVPVEVVSLLNDDENTPINMIGKKMVPILQKEDGSFMPESMDIIRYIDQNYGTKPVISKEINTDIAMWIENNNSVIFTLAKCRWIKVGLKEFATQGAINYFTKKKENYEGEFLDILKDSQEFIKDINSSLIVLDTLLDSEKMISDDGLSENDIHLFASLRSLSVTKGIKYPDKIFKYMSFLSRVSNIPLHIDIAI